MKRFTDEQIIKAVNVCGSTPYTCKGCPYRKLLKSGCVYKMLRDVYSLINRKNAEIERLEKESLDKEKTYNNEYFLRRETEDELKEHKAENKRLLQKLHQAKSAAIKEFAERVETLVLPLLLPATLEERDMVYRCLTIIDNLVKEMTEEESDV